MNNSANVFQFLLFNVSWKMGCICYWIWLDRNKVIEHN